MRRPDIVVKVSSSAARSPATSAKRYVGFGNGSCHFTKWRPPGKSPALTGLPLESSTGQRARSATIVTVYTASTSGRSGKYVIRRKPSGSHCVQNTPDDRYRPSSATLAAGSIRERIVSCPDGGGACSVSAVDDSVYDSGDRTAPSSATVTSCCCSPSRTSGRAAPAPSAAGLRRNETTAVTAVAAGSSSNVRSTVSTR